eukprot:5882175-Alexandrium_andersonii.AAC.1
MLHGTWGRPRSRTASLLSCPTARTVQAAPVPGPNARSHSRAARKSWPGRLGDGVLDVVGAPVGVLLQLSVGVGDDGRIGAQRAALGD